MLQSIRFFLSSLNEPFTAGLSDSLLFLGIALVTLGIFVLLAPRLEGRGRTGVIAAGIGLYLLSLICFSIPSYLYEILAIFLAPIGVSMVLGTLLGMLFVRRRIS